MCSLLEAYPEENRDTLNAIVNDKSSTGIDLPIFNFWHDNAKNNSIAQSILSQINLFFARWPKTYFGIEFWTYMIFEHKMWKWQYFKSWYVFASPDTIEMSELARPWVQTTQIDSIKSIVIKLNQH